MRLMRLMRTSGDILFCKLGWDLCVEHLELLLNPRPCKLCPTRFVCEVAHTGQETTQRLAGGTKISDHCLLQPESYCRAWMLLPRAPSMRLLPPISSRPRPPISSRPSRQTMLMPLDQALSNDRAVPQRLCRFTIDGVSTFFVSDGVAHTNMVGTFC